MRSRRCRSTRARAAGALLAAGLALGPSLARAQQPQPEPPPDQSYDQYGRPIPRPAQPEPEKKKPTPPKPLNYVPPVYPEEARKLGLEGEVILKLSVSTEGKVDAAEVATPGGHGFDEAALEAAKGLSFEPARRPDGTPFAARISYRYAFKLAPAEPAGPEPAAVKTGVLSGKVLIQAIDEPLAGATVTMVGPGGVPRVTVVTGVDGTFSFPDLLPGAYQLGVSAPGYVDFSATEDVEAGAESIATYRVSAELAGAIEVTVEGDRPPREVTRRTLEQREIARIPGTSGDALRSVQSLPGVARPPGLAGQLLVRGSGPFDTATFIDGIPVPLIYHFGGLSSVVPTELLSKIDFYPGNFSSRYGRVMGGIVDAGIRSPKNEYHGMAQVDLIDFRLMAEGPIPGFPPGWTFAAAGRRSWLDTWLGPVLEEAGAGVTQAPVYYDYQFLVEKRAPTWRYRTSFYGSDDKLELVVKEPAPGEPALSGDIGLHTAFMRLQFQADGNLTPRDRIESVFALGSENIDFGLGEIYFMLRARSLTGRLEYTHTFSDVLKLNVGADVNAGLYDVKVRLPSPPGPGQPPNQPFSTSVLDESNEQGTAIRPAGYLEFELTPDKRLRIVPGLRIDYTKDTKRLDVNPRLTARYLIADELPKTAVKAGIGVFTQPPQFQQSASSIGTPDLRSSRAIHYALGLEQDITEQVDVSVEGFVKQLNDQIVGRPSASGTGLDYDNKGLGYVVGAEVLLKYKPDKHFFGWLAYTLSRSARQNGPGEPEYLVSFDQTHILTVLGSYQVGNGWEFGARFRLISGNLLTPNVCDFTDKECDPKRIGGFFHGPSGAYTAVPFGSVTSERLPVFHQLDVRVDKKWELDGWQLSTYLDVQNAYNSLNVEGLVYNYNFTARQYLTGIPILPSVGLRGEF
ncbi:MAG: TonB-dependent receptor [Polyangiaceae bacterium]|nr:TonB-dependent receptor [Polyangiaceae bacterium]